MTYKNVKDQIEAMLKKKTPIQSSVIPPSQQLEAYKKGGDVRHNLISILAQEHYWNDRLSKGGISKEEHTKKIEHLRNIWQGFMKAKEESSIWYQAKEAIKKAEEDILSYFKKGIDIAKIVVPALIGLIAFRYITELLPRRR